MPAPCIFRPLVQRPDLGLLPLFGVSQDDSHHAVQLSVGRSTLLNITNLIAPLARWPTSLRCKIFDVVFFCSHSDLHIDLSLVPNHHAVVLLMALKHNFIYSRRVEGYNLPYLLRAEVVLELYSIQKLYSSQTCHICIFDPRRYNLDPSQSTV